MPPFDLNVISTYDGDVRYRPRLSLLPSKHDSQQANSQTRYTTLRLATKLRSYPLNSHSMHQRLSNTTRKRKILIVYVVFTYGVQQGNTATILDS